MGRPREGFSLRRRPGQTVWKVRFVDDAGKQHELSTGKEDRDEAAREAARLYREHGGERRNYAAAPGASPARMGVGQQLGPLAAHWLATLANVLDEETVTTYAGYFSAHFVPFFRTLEHVTTATSKAYARDRLGKVKASTVRKELSVLRSFCAWCAAVPPDGPGLLDEPPTIPGIPKRVVGTAHPQGKREAQWWTIEETQAILRALPERSRRFGNRVRAALYVAYQTSLRPETVATLSIPENYVPGSRELRIWAKDDKGRYQRVVQLSRGARLMLFWSRPLNDRGVIFGRHDYRHALKKAAREVLGVRAGSGAQAYNFRRARITHAAEITGNVRLTQEIAGHSRLSTTETYFERLRTKRGTDELFRTLDTETRKRLRKDR